MRTRSLLIWLAIGSSPLTATHAQTYNWANWSQPTSTTAQATVGGLGSVALSVADTATSTGLYTVQFLGVPFTPTIAPAAAANNGQTQAWSFSLDFSSISNTLGLIVGIGNLGHGDASLPGYSFLAKNSANVTIAPSAFTQIGSYDHTWISPPTSLTFNDNVSLNTTTSQFDFVTVSGGDNFNSDILFLSLPAQVKTILIQSNGTMGGDTVNVLVAGPIPEPASWAFLVAGLVALRTYTRRRVCG